MLRIIACPCVLTIFVRGRPRCRRCRRGRMRRRFIRPASGSARARSRRKRCWRAGSRAMSISATGIRMRICWPKSCGSCTGRIGERLRRREWRRLAAALLSHFRRATTWSSAAACMARRWRYSLARRARLGIEMTAVDTCDLAATDRGNSDEHEAGPGRDDRQSAPGSGGYRGAG